MPVASGGWGDVQTRADERRAALAQEVADNGAVHIAEAAARFGVSQVTLRNDLQALSRAGTLVRMRGGAVAVAGGAAVSSLRRRPAQPASAAERALIRETAALVVDGDSVALDGSDLGYWIAGLLRDRRDLTVVAGALNTAQRLATVPTNTVILGGSLLGADGIGLRLHPDEHPGHGLRVRLALLCCGGCDREGVLYAADPYTAAVKRALMACARTAVLLLTHAEPDPQEVAPFGTLAAVGRILTLQPLAPEVSSLLTHCQVTLCGGRHGAVS